MEPFDVNGVPPSGWSIQNPDNSFTWEERNNIIGSDGNPTLAAYIDNSNYLGISEQDNLTTDIYDLTNLTGGVLNFDLAKAQYSASASDILYIAISIDCGDSFSLVYGLSGLALSTIPDYNTTNNWSPQAADEWRTEHIDLSGYAGEQIIIRFINQNNNGNSTYIDNVNISGTLSVTDNELTGISFYPNPTSEKVNISFNSNHGNSYQVKLINSLGQVVHEIEKTSLNGSNTISLDVSNFSVGLYFIKIEVDNLSTIKKLLIK